jgi:anti-sigma regulatory factor (Ser/Thr protein kinase)
VLDEGPGFAHIPALPRDVYSESGRGLFIISLLSDDFNVAVRPEGGSHARAVLAFSRRRNEKPSVSAALTPERGSAPRAR